MKYSPKLLQETVSQDLFENRLHVSFGKKKLIPIHSVIIMRKEQSAHNLNQLFFFWGGWEWGGWNYYRVQDLNLDCAILRGRKYL